MSRAEEPRKCIFNFRYAHFVISRQKIIKKNNRSAILAPPPVVGMVNNGDSQ